MFCFEFICFFLIILSVEDDGGMGWWPQPSSGGSSFGLVAVVLLFRCKLGVCGG